MGVVLGACPTALVLGIAPDDDDGNNNIIIINKLAYFLACHYFGQFFFPW